MCPCLLQWFAPPLVCTGAIGLDGAPAAKPNQNLREIVPAPRIRHPLAVAPKAQAIFVEPAAGNRLTLALGSIDKHPLPGEQLSAIGQGLAKALPGRLELPTLRLTASRSNQLSYGSLISTPSRPSICLAVKKTRMGTEALEGEVQLLIRLTCLWCCLWLHGVAGGFRPEGPVAVSTVERLTLEGSFPGLFQRIGLVLIHKRENWVEIASSTLCCTRHPGSLGESCHLDVKTVCPSGLRGWTQVPLAQAAWVQIPQLSLRGGTACACSTPP